MECHYWLRRNLGESNKNVILSDIEAQTVLMTMFRLIVKMQRKELT